MDVAIVGPGDHAFGVVLVLHFHACEAAEVYVGAEVATSCGTLLNAHVQVERLVSLVLAIGDARFLLRGLGIAKVSLDAVLLALAE